MTKKEIFDYLVSLGFTKAGAAGLMGNLKAESNLNPKNLQNTFERKLGLTDSEYTKAVDAGTYDNFVKDSAGYGLAQWTFWTRKQNLLNYARKKGLSIGDCKMQLDFLYEELKGYKSVFEVLKTTDSIQEASDIVLTKYEKPADQSEAVQKKRAQYGQDIYNECVKKKNESEVAVMATKVIALDAGHGLKTPGKRTPDGIHEWELNDKVRDQVVKNLKDYDCEFIFPDKNEGSTDESLTSRRTMYVNEDVDAAVSIHHNATSDKWVSQGIGVETWVDKNCTKADRELAECIQKRLPDYTGLKDRGIKEQNWAVINQNKVPAVLTEGGFMNSRKDYEVITSEEGQAGYARAISEGLIEFLNLKKKKTSSNSTKKDTSTPSTNKDTSLKFKVGDTVQFKGTKHYKSSEGTISSSCKGGKAKVTAIAKGAKHPYHLQNVSGGGSTVYGWVDEKYVSKVTTSSNKNTAYFDKYTGNSYGIDTVFKAIGVPEKFRDSWAKRKPIAQANGIDNYKGGQSDNLSLIALAKKGKLKKP